MSLRNKKAWRVDCTACDFDDWHLELTDALRASHSHSHGHVLVLTLSPVPVAVAAKLFAKPLDSGEQQTLPLTMTDGNAV